MRDYALFQKAKLAECEICGGKTFKELLIGDRFCMGLRSVICMNCAFVFTNPRPTEDEMRRFYKKDYRDFYFDWDSPEREGYSESVIGRASATRAKTIAAFLKKETANFSFKPERALDIGCGDGKLLAKISQIFPKTELFGIEPSKAYASYVMKNPKVKVCNAFFDKILESDMAELRFDLVLLSHVIEHLYDPLMQLKNIASRMSDKALLLLEAPNLLSSHWREGTLEMFHIAHCCHFTPNTLAFAAQQAGLKILAADTGKHEAEPWAMTFLLTKSSPEEKRSAYSADEEIEAISKHLELLVEAEGDAWPSSKDFNKCQIGKIDQEFIVKYCRLRFEKILADIPLGEKLVCWGTGTHSVFLLKALSEDILKRINFFIDEIEIPSYFFNWKVFHPDKVDWSKVATVVISTDANENELSKRAEKMLPSNVKIEKLYEPLGADKIISAKWK